MSNIAAPSTSPFTVWLDWMNTFQAGMLAPVSSAAIRHEKMSGVASTNNIFWFRTGSRGEASGILTTMEHSGDVHISPGVHQLITFLQTLPTDVRQEIIHSLNTASIGVPK